MGRSGRQHVQAPCEFHVNLQQTLAGRALQLEQALAPVDNQPTCIQACAKGTLPSRAERRAAGAATVLRTLVPNARAIFRLLADFQMADDEDGGAHSMPCSPTRFGLLSGGSPTATLCVFAAGCRFWRTCTT